MGGSFELPSSLLGTLRLATSHYKLLKRMGLVRISNYVMQESSSSIRTREAEVEISSPKGEGRSREGGGKKDRNFTWLKRLSREVLAGEGRMTFLGGTGGGKLAEAEEEEDLRSESCLKASFSKESRSSALKSQSSNSMQLSLWGDGRETAYDTMVAWGGGGFEIWKGFARNSKSKTEKKKRRGGIHPSSL
ncbi:hypothetical protein ACLOJK_015759 [Asimina triloba]